MAGDTNETNVKVDDEEVQGGKKKLQRSFFDFPTHDIVTITWKRGNKSLEFSVHKALISASSAHFQKIFSEPETRGVIYEGIRLRTIILFLEWLYGRDLPTVWYKATPDEVRGAQEGKQDKEGVKEKDEEEEDGKAEKDEEEEDRKEEQGEGAVDKEKEKDGEADDVRKEGEEKVEEDDVEEEDSDSDESEGDQDELEKETIEAQLEETSKGVARWDDIDWLIVFANRYQIWELREDAFEHVHEVFTKYNEMVPTSIAVRVAFENLPESAPERRLYVDLYATRYEQHYDQSDEAWEEFQTSTPQSFWIEWALCMARVRDTRTGLALPDVEQYLNGEARIEKRQK